MSIKRVMAAVISAGLMVLQTLPALACAPAFPEAVMFNTLRPDLPLKSYAAGNLGVVQGSYAKSYLCVAYRYLISAPLSLSEQKSICRLWYHRLGNMPTEEGDALIAATEKYLDLRKKALNAKKDKTDEDVYSYTENVSEDAFKRACITLSALLTKYGTSSAPVKEWLKAQDQVFASAKDGNKREFDKLTSSEKGHRLNQEAAMAFYTKDYAKADKLYRQIAADSKSPWHDIALYMVARTGTTAVNTGDKNFDYNKVLEELDKSIVQSRDFDMRQDLKDLRAPYKYSMMSRQDLLELLAKSVPKPGNERFGADVGDLTYAMDEMEESPEQVNDEKEQEKKIESRNQAREALMAKQDLSDWLETIQFTEREYEFYSVTQQIKMKEASKRHAAHALAMYTKSHSLPWLLAAVVTNGLRSDQNADLLKAAQQIAPNSPAFDTINFYLIDRLISTGQVAQARSRIQSELSKSTLTATNQNLFKAQMLAVASSTDTYLKSAKMRAADVCTYYSYVPSNWASIEKTGKGALTPVTFDDEVAINLNRYLPLARLINMALTESDAGLRGRLARSAWLKAHLLGEEGQAHKLTTIFAASYPPLKKQIMAVDHSTGDEARYQLAKLTLKNYGMTPYLASGVERHGLPIYEFDYYNTNFWKPLTIKEPKPNPQEMWAYYSDNAFDQGCCAKPQNSTLLMQYLQGYYSRGVESTLSNNEKQKAASELARLTKTSPSEFMGEAVFRKFKSKPGEQSLPEMLYRVVKLPKWSVHTEVGSVYSHRAYNLLQNSFGKSNFARRAPYWY